MNQAVNRQIEEIKKRTNKQIEQRDFTIEQMPRKQYRQRGMGKVSYAPQAESHQSGFISYSSHLRKKEEQEMKVLEKIDYNYSCKPVKKNDNQIFLFMKHKKREDTQLKDYDAKLQPTQKDVMLKATQLNGTNSKLAVTSPHQTNTMTNCSPKNTQNYQKIDTSAVVIKGRLIYLQQQTSQSPSNDHFMELLRQNSISNKQFLTGNQKQIKDQIKKNESVKQNEIIKDYILRNMSEQSNGEVVVMERFYQVKDYLFD